MEGRDENRASPAETPSGPSAEAVGRAGSSGETGRRWIVGLGNPGPEYEATRHNVGFRVVEEVARRLDVRLVEGECRARLGSGTPDDSPELGLVQPLTYMNRSGATLRCLAERHDVEPRDFLVVYDEVHLALGRLRLRSGGSPAGHRGLASILESLASDAVPRLRLGIAGEGGTPDGEELSDFVLSPFEEEEREDVEEMISRAADAALAWAGRGIDFAMQKHNG